jgi:hypothetical protein
MKYQQSLNKKEYMFTPSYNSRHVFYSCLNSSNHIDNNFQEFGIKITKKFRISKFKKIHKIYTHLIKRKL